MKPVSLVFPWPARRLALCAALAASGLAGCSSNEGLLSGDKVDYKSQSRRTTPLDVPPDLTQLAREGRYQPHQGSVSASALAAGQVAAPATGAAPQAQGASPSAVSTLQVLRAGDQRWLKTALPAEQLWPQLRAFWQERGFAIVVDSPEAGVMETDWAENRVKLPKDGIRKMLGGILDNLYDSGERDRFRTRVERVEGGSEVFITHRGLEEVFDGTNSQRTFWRPRAADPQLEAEILSRLMIKLGAKDDVARASVAAAVPSPARARLLGGQSSATLEVDEAFERAWRRVGVALDRSGFTVEDRDRNAGLYFVRYVDPKLAAKEEPGFFARMFGNASPTPSALGRYRINVKAAGDKTQVSVLDNQGGADKGEVAQRIVALLVDDLK